jgi:hypothetical protein
VNFRYSTSLATKAYEQPECLIRSIGDSDQPTDLSASVVDLKLRAVMCVRLSFKDDVLGVIYVDSRATARQFTRRTRSSALARAISIARERPPAARRPRAERLQRSLEIAREVLAALPRRTRRPRRLRLAGPDPRRDGGRRLLRLRAARTAARHRHRRRDRPRRRPAMVMTGARLGCASCSATATTKGPSSRG